MPDAPEPDHAPAPTAREGVRARKLAHTDAERSDALAELRAAGAEFNRLYPLLQAASERREKATVRAWEVGFSTLRIGKELRINYRTANRLVKRAHGQVQEVGRRYADRTKERGAGDG